MAQKTAPQITCTVPARGLFGSDADSGSYVCVIEQMPNFALPTVTDFSKRFVSSNILEQKIVCEDALEIVCEDMQD